MQNRFNTLQYQGFLAFWFVVRTSPCFWGQNRYELSEILRKDKLMHEKERGTD